jgi:hypothetical protein
MDGVQYKNTFQFQHQIDDFLKSGNKIKFAGNEFSLSELNSLFPPTENKISLLIEWDNMCQYTAFGLVSVLNDLCETNEKIDLVKFFERRDYPLGFDYVKKEIFPKIRGEIIDSVIINYYPEILESSPITKFFNSLNLLKFMLSSVTFLFHHDIPDEALGDFMEDISFNKFNKEIGCDYIKIMKEENEIEFIKRTKFDLYVVPDAGLYYKTFLDKDIKERNILTYLLHNGISPLIIAYLESTFKGIKNIPNNISIQYLTEIKEENSNET